MARIARVVVPGTPHHVTQRGNRRQRVFFGDEDYKAYLGFLSEGCSEAGTEIWAYCLMPNHVHLLLVPFHGDGLRRALSEAHRRYTRMVNFREGWRGHLWQERFASFPASGQYLLNVARYIELNPVRAKMVFKPEDWPWSSAMSRVTGCPNSLLSSAGNAAFGGITDWSAFLGEGLDDPFQELVRKHESTGRPLGPEDFIKGIEAVLGRIFSPQKRGPKPKEKHI